LSSGCPYDLTLCVTSRGSLGVATPSAERLLVLPDESGTLLSTASLSSNLRAVGALTAGSIGAGFGDIATGGSLAVGGAAAFSVGQVVADNSFSIPAGKTIVKVLARAGVHSNAFAIQAGTDGQLLVRALYTLHSSWMLCRMQTRDPLYHDMLTSSQLVHDAKRFGLCKKVMH
jgi:hypothetical protein